MIKILALSALCSLAAAQFGGGQSCDYNRLQQAFQRKEQCLQDFYALAIEAQQAIQGSDRMCNQGMVQVVQKCQQPIEMFRQRNDLDNQGMFECCFPGKVGGFGNSRQCEFRNKEMKDKKKEKGGRWGGDKKGGEGMGGMRMMNKMEMEQKFMNSMTFGDLVMLGAEENIKMVEHLMWCKEEERMINDQAMNTFKRYKDQLYAKLFQCENMIIQEATNCTDVSAQDLKCMMTGYDWIEKFMKTCFWVCSPNSLNEFCTMITSNPSGGNQQIAANFFNNNPNGFGNQNQFEPNFYNRPQ